MQNIFIVFMFFLLMFSSSCKEKNHSKEFEAFGVLDIAANNKEVVFSYFKADESSIYSLNMENGNVKKIIGAKDGVNYYNPKYSPDNKKIVFISGNKTDVNSTLCIANADGSDIQKLTNDDEIITEATFSIDGEYLYFCKANNYTKYSPIGRKAAHNFDIYSLSLIDRKVKKITNLRSYDLSNISEVDNMFLLVHLSGSDNGIYLCSKEDGTKPIQIFPTNTTLPDASFCYNPIYSDSLKMIGFTAPYALYVMNLIDKKASLIFSNTGDANIGNIVFYKNQPKILFSKFRYSDLFSINIDGTDLKTISISIN